ncbi:MAG TPA: adenosine kinase [Candidatus Cybelea sp.]|nr:adenosine kinase [Candidatus Cybelea sp.]
MTETRLHVLGIGNAIVDVLSQVKDDFLVQQNLKKGAMTLVDASRADELYRAMPPAVECSGGSAANTIAGIASLGGRAGYVGKVRDDQLGQVFAHDIRSLGVEFASAPASRGPSTARCLIMVTPDAQRTMQTYLGACVELTAHDIDEKQVAAAEITYLEGYLWDPPQAKEAFRRAIRVAHDAGRRVALSLSDAFCVDRYRSDFLHLVRDDVDILFANEQEITALYQVKDFDAALQHVRELDLICALTRSAKGSVIVAGKEIHVIDAEPVARVMDTTGAGDLYAAGFLWGLTDGQDLRTCGRVAGLCAAEIISHLGARPQTSLADLVRQTLG